MIQLHSKITDWTVFCVYLPNTFIKSCTGESSLTIDALAKHDEQQIDKDGDVSFKAESDVVSAAGKTFNTWATNWTECTNTTFGRVHRYWASNSAFHKEVIKLNKMLSLHSVGGVLWELGCLWTISMYNWFNIESQTAQTVHRPPFPWFTCWGRTCPDKWQWVGFYTNYNTLVTAFKGWNLIVFLTNWLKQDSEEKAKEWWCCINMKTSAEISEAFWILYMITGVWTCYLGVSTQTICYTCVCLST